MMWFSLAKMALKTGAEVYKNKKETLAMFANHYDDANLWFQRWRIFFLTVEEFFKINDGNEWFVNHYLLEKKYLHLCLQQHSFDNLTLMRHHILFFQRML